MGAGAAAAGISAVGSIAGAAISSSGKSSSGSTTTAPWSYQAAPLNYGYDQAANTYWNRSRDFNDYFAQQNNVQTDANQNLANDANSFGRIGFANQAVSGANNMSALDQYHANAAANAQNGIGTQNPALSGVLTNYATTGNLPGQSQVNPAVSNAVAGASMGSLGSLSQGQQLALQAGQTGLNTGAAAANTAANANQFINNGTLNGQIDALGTDLSRNLNETTLPGIRAAAQASGNVNSSREGALEAIAGRGTQENLLNAAANLRGSAYNNGLNVANSQYGTGLSAAVNSAQALNNNGATGMSGANTWQGLQQNQNQFDTSTRLGAANSQQTQNLGWDVGDATARNNANSQLGTASALANTNLSTGVNGLVGADQTVRGAGDYVQTADQAALSAADTRNQSLLNDYWNVVSRGYNGANSNTTATTSGGGTAGALTGAIGGATTGLGLADKVTGGQATSGLQNWIYSGLNDSTGTSGGAGTSALQSLGFLGPSLSGSY